MQSTILCDADHAHDKRTRRSITGLLVYIGQTPVSWSSRRQTAIASSTYAAEFMALRHATEEAISIRFALRSFGIPVVEPTRILGDNMSVIQNATNPDVEVKKKHVAISFHLTQEAIAAGVIEPWWLGGTANLSDIMTKQIGRDPNDRHCRTLFFQPSAAGLINDNLSSQIRR